MSIRSPEQLEVVAARARRPRRPRAAPRPRAARVGSGRFGSAASAAERRSSTPRSSSSSSFSRAERRAPRRSPPRRPHRARCSSPMRLLAAFLLRAAAPRARAASRGGARRARAPRRARAGSTPRRREAPRARGSGSRAGSRLRSSTDAPLRPAPSCRASRPPEYLARKSATASASSPTTMFAGMIAPEKPPLRIANSTSSRFSLRTLKFGPLVRSPPSSCPRRLGAVGVGGLQRVAARAALVEEHGAARAPWRPAQAPRSCPGRSPRPRRRREGAGDDERCGSRRGIVPRRMAASSARSLLATLLAAGCGDSRGPRRPHRHAPAERRLVVSAKEYRFDPATIVVAGRAAADDPPAQRRHARPRHPRAQGRPRRRRHTELPRRRDARRQAEPRARPLRALCTVGDHAELGMRGELIVK